MKKIAFLMILLSFVMLGRSQTVSFGDNYIVDSKTHIPIIIDGFNQGIDAISLKFTYNSDLLTYDNCVVKNQLSSNGTYLSNNVNNTFIFGWYANPSLSPPNVQLNDTIIEIVFENNKLGCEYLNWYNEYNSCEISWYDINYPLITMTYPTIFTDKYICINSYDVNITGSVEYHNGSLLYPINVELYDNNYNYVCSQGSLDGTYEFVNVPCGKYIINANTSIPAGGFNAVDALLTTKHFVNIQQLDDIQQLAADVDNTGYINTSDALNILTRFVYGNNFQNPWIFKWKEINAYSNDNCYTIEGICKGDVNNSYMESSLSKTTPIESINFKIDSIYQNSTNLYITFSDSIPPVASISLVFDHYSPYFQIGNGIFFTQSGMGISNNVGSSTIISWFSLTLEDIDTLIKFPITISSNTLVCDSLIFSQDSCSITDLLGNPISIYLYDTAIIHFINENDKKQPYVYASYQIIYVENTDYTDAEIYDLSGKLQWTGTNLPQNNKFSIGLWDKGMYIIKLYKKNETYTKKFIIWDDYR